jgi:hypothetical protein
MRFKSSVLALVVGLSLGLMIVPFQSRAEDGGSSGSDLSLHMGYLLPNQIDGVTEILPVYGARYAFGLGSVGSLELGFGNSHAEGVDFTTFTASLRGDVPVAPDIAGIFYGGVDEVWYRPVTDETRKLETGVHFGTGVMFKVTNTLWLRTDLKFMGGPGTSLYLGFGLAFRDAAAGGG